MGQYDQAIEYAQKALELNMEAYGEEHAEVAHCNISLGSAYRLKEMYDKALEHFSKALEIRTAILPPDHKDIARSKQHIEETIKMQKGESDEKDDH